MKRPADFGVIELSRILAGQPHAPVVYFARMGDNVKIGTTTNLTDRMKRLYVPLTDVLAVVPGGKEVEDAYHERFRASQVTGDFRKELFRLDWKLKFFLGLTRADRSAAVPGALPLSLGLGEEAGNVLDLDNDLRMLEGGGSGSWDHERAADLVNRITYLDSIRPQEDPLAAGYASMSAYYWKATRGESLAELQELGKHVRCRRPRWWFLDPAERAQRRFERENLARIQAHAERAGIIHDLFVDAIRAYEPEPVKETRPDGGWIDWDAEDDEVVTT